jgi:hypothetical protein
MSNREEFRIPFPRDSLAQANSVRPTKATQTPGITTDL